jgi:NADPH:quinone reductase-like Zn-dependent oxidoreductase
MDAAEDQTNINLLTLRKTVTLKGIINGPRDRFEEMIGFYEKHKIQPVVNRVFSFKESKEAFKFLASGGHFGKVVIQVKP